MTKREKKEESWGKRFDETFGMADMPFKDTLTGYVARSEKIKSFIKKELTKERERVILKIDKKIVERMIKYANTPLKERQNAYDELFEIRKILTN